MDMSWVMDTSLVEFNNGSATVTLEVSVMVAQAGTYTGAGGSAETQGQQSHHKMHSLVRSPHAREGSSTRTGAAP
jgi:hypothetical protein